MNNNTDALRAFETEMRIANLSPITIRDRLELIRRFADTIDHPLIDATTGDLLAFQARFTHLAPASIDIYTRHLRAFYRWARRRGHITADPTEDMVAPKLTRGLPHPATPEDLAVIFACTKGLLRKAYVLAAFAGLRCGEICRLHRRDLNLAEPATALVHGKGRRERIVPLLPAVLSEIGAYTARGWVVALPDGQPVSPDRLSAQSSRYLHGLGVMTTLHSMRHTFATNAARMTKDPLFVRDLLGHQSVATTEIYMGSDMEAAHARLAGMTAQAEQILNGRRLHAVREMG